MDNLFGPILKIFKKQPLFIVLGFLLLLLMVMVLSGGKRFPEDKRLVRLGEVLKRGKGGLERETTLPSGSGEKVPPLTKLPKKEGGLEEEAWSPSGPFLASPFKVATTAGDYVMSTFSISPSGTLVKRTCSRIDEGGECSIANVSGRIAGVVVEALDELYKLTEDPKYQDKTFEVGEAIVKACSTDLESCRWGFFGLYTLYQKTGEQKYLNSMLAALPRLNNQGINLYAASENLKKIIMLYQVSGEFSYLSTALSEYETVINNLLIDESKNPALYKTVKGFQVRKFDCQKIWGVDLQLYQATGEEKYLNKVKSFFENSDLGTSLSNIEELPQLNHCLDALIDLFEETKEERFKRQAATLARFIVENFWDSPALPKFNGDGAFVIFTTADPKYKKHNLKCAAETAWMVKNLARLSRVGISLIP